MSNRPCRPVGPESPDRVRIRSDLRERGIAPELREAFAERLAPISRTGSPEAYAAALDAVVLAYRNGSSAAAAPASVSELQQLMAGFAGELRKLEEAMRALDAYVARMRSQTEIPEAGRLH